MGRSFLKVSFISSFLSRTFYCGRAFITSLSSSCAAARTDCRTSSRPSQRSTERCSSQPLSFVDIHPLSSCHLRRSPSLLARISHYGCSSALPLAVQKISEDRQLRHRGTWLR